MMPRAVVSVLTLVVVVACVSATPKSAVTVHVIPLHDRCIRDGDRLEKLTSGALGHFARGARGLELEVDFDGIGFEFAHGLAGQSVRRPFYIPNGHYAIRSMAGNVVESGALPATGSVTETECLLKTATWLAQRVGAVRPATEN